MNDAQHATQHLNKIFHDLFDLMFAPTHGGNNASSFANNDGERLTGGVAGFGLAVTLFSDIAKTALMKNLLADSDDLRCSLWGFEKN